MSAWNPQQLDIMALPPCRAENRQILEKCLGPFPGDCLESFPAAPHTADPIEVGIVLCSPALLFMFDMLSFVWRGTDGWEQAREATRDRLRIAGGVAASSVTVPPVSSRRLRPAMMMAAPARRMKTGEPQST